MDNLSAGVIGGNLGNYQNNLGFIHIPKCAGCSVAEYLHKIGRWHPIDDNSKTFAAEPFIKFKTYTLFTVVRHPITWLLSGYKFYKQRRSYDLTFDEHIDSLMNNSVPDVSDEKFDWYWHCKLLPDGHIGNLHVTVCKLEEIDKLRNYLFKWFPKALDFEIPITNTTDYEYVDISQKTLNKIKNLTGSYARRFDYEF